MNALLDEFGVLMIHQIRDETIDDWNMLLDGKMKGDLAAKARALCSQLNPSQVETVKAIVRMVVDTAVHHTMRAIDESSSLAVTLQSESGRAIDVREASDGLAGELYGTRGWIARFSRFPQSD